MLILTRSEIVAVIRSRRSLEVSTDRKKVADSGIVDRISTATSLLLAFGPMAKGSGGRKRSSKPKEAEPYRHPTAEAVLRPEIGTQPQFKKKKPPQLYRYDSSLSPALEWDGGNAARAQGEVLIRQSLEAPDLETAQKAAAELARLSQPFLQWAGKGERLSFEVPTRPSSSMSGFQLRRSSRRCGVTNRGISSRSSISSGTGSTRCTSRSSRRTSTRTAGSTA